MKGTGMGRPVRWFVLIGLVAALALLLAGCQSTEPVAQAGPEEEEEACTDCHNETTLVKARQLQVNASVHATGGNFERNSASCAICHTSEGFRKRLAAGSVDIGEDAIENPSSIGCRTCHEIHTTYTKDDFALAVTGPVTLELTGDTIDLGKGNLCGTCHQPRWSYEVPAVGGPDVEITSPYWGPHYGTQSTMITGLAGYGSFSGTSVHSSTFVKDGCPTCHMADAYGVQAGGHTMKMEYEYHGHETANVAGCQSCHEGLDTFDRNGVQTEVQAMLDELKSLLVARGLLDESGRAVKGTFTSAQVGALWNYKTVLGDGSLGVHNPQFAKALLKTAIDALK